MKALTLAFSTLIAIFSFAQSENRTVCTVYEGKLPDQLIHFQIPSGKNNELLCIDSLFINHKHIPLELVKTQNFDFDLQYCGIDVKSDITIRIYHPANCSPVVVANWKRRPKKTVLVFNSDF